MPSIPFPALCRRLSLTLLLAASLVLPVAAQGLDPAEIFREALRERVGLPATQETLAIDGQPLQSQEELTRFYLLRAFQPAWIDANGMPTAAAADIAARLARVHEDGLDPTRYRQDAIGARLDALRADGAMPSLDDLVDFDLLVSDGWLTLGGHLLRGRVDPEKLYGQWLATPRERDLASLLDTALAAGEPVQVLEELQPAYPNYVRLREALANLRTIDPASEPPGVPSGVAMRLGDDDERVPALRRRLHFLGLLDPAASLDDTRFDGYVDAALLAFQQRSGLEPDGIFGRGTRAMVNTTIAERIAQVELNMERFRWLPQKFEPRHLRINIADFSLELVEDGEVTLAMDVIVGRPYRETPVFSGRMTYLTFSPAWHLPPTISREDILPRLRKDPQGVVDDGIRVFSGWGADEREVDPLQVDWRKVSSRSLPYHFRQDPGPKNALGRVKFMFPNRFSVYLHDTPARELFDRAQRDFSSGCIRVQKPKDLAVQLLMDDPAWTPARIEEAMNGGKEQNVSLTRPLPVHLAYLTAWVDDSGVLQFREDIYDRDKRLREALATR